MYISYFIHLCVRTTERHVDIVFILCDCMMFAITTVLLLVAYYCLCMCRWNTYIFLHFQITGLSQSYVRGDHHIILPCHIFNAMILMSHHQCHAINVTSSIPHHQCQIILIHSFDALIHHQMEFDHRRLI